MVTDQPVVARARQVWRELAGVPVTFGDSGIEVVASPRSLLCPPGWAGIIVLDGAAIATVPEPSAVRLVQQACYGLPAAALTDPAVLRNRLPVAETLGPAMLGYCDAVSFRPIVADGGEAIPAGHADLQGLLASVPVDEADESGLADITSAAFVVREEERVTAAAGYRRWPADAAHLSVLTALDHRGRGLARAVAAAAVADALAAGLLPQWRARPEASRRVARALGFHDLGSQLSFRLDDIPAVGSPRGGDRK